MASELALKSTFFAELAILEASYRRTFNNLEANTKWWDRYTRFSQIVITHAPETFHWFANLNDERRTYEPTRAFANLAELPTETIVAIVNSMIEESKSA